MTSAEGGFAGDRITIDPAMRFGKPCIAGTRIAVQEVIELVEAGLGRVEMRRDYYPDATVEDIEACMAYAANFRPTGDVSK